MAFTARPPDMSFLANQYAGLGAGLEKAGDAIAQLIQAKKQQKDLIKMSTQMLTKLQTFPGFKELLPEGTLESRAPREHPMLLKNVITLENLMSRQRKAQREEEEAVLLGKERAASIAFNTERTAQMKREAAAETDWKNAMGEGVSEFVPTMNAETEQQRLWRGLQKFPGALGVPNVEARMKALQALTGDQTVESMALGAEKPTSAGTLIGMGQGRAPHFTATPAAKAVEPTVILPNLPFITSTSDEDFSRGFGHFSETMFESGSDPKAINDTQNEILKRRKLYKEGRRPLSLNEQIALEAAGERALAKPTPSGSTVKVTKGGRTITIPKESLKRARELGWTPR